METTATALRERLETDYPQWKTLYDAVKDSTVGVVFTFAQLKAMTGFNIQGAFRGLVYRANKSLLKDYRKCLISVPGEGYKIATPEEQIKSASFRRTKASRQLRKGTAEAMNINESLMTDEQKLRATHLVNHLQTSLGTLRKTSQKALTKTKQAVKTQESGIDKIDAMMKELALLKNELIK